MSSRILFLDTTQPTLKLALAQDWAGDFLAEITSPSTSYRYHSATLVPMLQTQLSAVYWQPQDISDIALNSGPGSFTGLRTGVAVAKTLAQLFGCRLHVFNTFQCLVAETLQQQQKRKSQGEVPLTVTLDARRGNVYTATYSVKNSAKKAQLLEISAPQCVLAEGFSVSCETPDALFTPAMMCWLKQHTENDYTVDWQDCLPLYLQGPSITVSKKLKTHQKTH